MTQTAPIYYDPEMDSRLTSPPPADVRPPALPSWALTHANVISEADAAFTAGVALNCLDNLVRSEPIWVGCWRQRLALKSAVAGVRLQGRSDDEHALRDALLLTAAGDDPGPGRTCVFGL